MDYSQYLPSGATSQLPRTSLGDISTPRGFGDEAKKVDEEFSNAELHYSQPISRTTPIQKFDRLAATWEYNNANMSSISEMALLPSYQEIIGMGKDAIPLILDALKNKPNHWFWALKAITGENPVQPADRGNIKMMTATWLEWGKQNGYIAK